MRKIIAGFITLLIVVIVGVFFFAPTIINSQINSKIQQKIKTNQVEVHLDSSPEFMLLFGQIDNLYLTGNDISLDKVKLNNLTLKGTNIDFSVEDLLLARRLVINSAEELSIQGTIDEENLAKLLSDKIDNVSDIAVSINPENIEATGRVSLFGKSAMIHVVGHLLIQDNKLIFRITNADTSGGILGKIGVSFTKDIVVSNTTSLPIENARFTKIEQQNGQVLILADIDKLY